MPPKPALRPPPWLARMARPWIVATTGGLLLGVGLIRLETSVALDLVVDDSQPRAAVYDPPSLSLMPRDPFLPAGTLTAPPEAPAAEPTPAPVAAATEEAAP